MAEKGRKKEKQKNVTFPLLKYVDDVTPRPPEKRNCVIISRKIRAWEGGRGVRVGGGEGRRGG